MRPHLGTRYQLTIKQRHLYTSLANTKEGISQTLFRRVLHYHYIPNAPQNPISNSCFLKPLYWADACFVVVPLLIALAFSTPLATAEQG